MPARTTLQFPKALRSHSTILHISSPYPFAIPEIKMSDPLSFVVHVDNAADNSLLYRAKLRDFVFVHLYFPQTIIIQKFNRNSTGINDQIYK